MKGYDVVIIGGGLGGLQCAYILSKKGLNVCLVEKEKHIGGCLQSFKKDGCSFDTGFHYVGGLKEGQALHRIFNYFGLLGLPWRRMDESGYEEVFLNGKSYLHASGHQRFADTLASQFPDQRKDLSAYVSFLKRTGEKIFRVLEREETDLQGFYSSLFSQSAYGFLHEMFDDPLLVNVVAGASFKIDFNPDKLPLYVFAQVNELFMEGAWRLKGGGSLIADRLADQIRQQGGTIRTGCKAVSLEAKDGKINGAVLETGEQITGNIFVSDIHPALLVGLLKEPSLIRPVYRNRIVSLENSMGVFTVNVKLKPNRLPYQDRNLHIHTGQDVWAHRKHIPGQEEPYLMVNYYIPEQGDYADRIDLIAPMPWEEVSAWDVPAADNRGEDYREFKQKRAEAYIRLASQYIPGLKEAIDKLYISTPLTYRDYTGTVNGSAYGIEKDYDRVMQTVLAPNTPVPNLFLTGQNLCVHGVLGVSMTSFLTCGQIIGPDSVWKELNFGDRVKLEK